MGSRCRYFFWWTDPKYQSQGQGLTLLYGPSIRPALQMNIHDLVRTDSERNLYMYLSRSHTFRRYTFLTRPRYTPSSRMVYTPPKYLRWTSS